MNPFSAWIDIKRQILRYMRQILTYKVGPRAEKVQVFIMTVDP